MQQRQPRAEHNARVALYARVSTEDQAERETVKSQLDFLRRFCDLHQIPVADEYVDDGISGAIPLDRRPEGGRLLADAGTDRFGAVLVFRVSRLGRSSAALLSAYEALDRVGVTIRSGTEPFDTATPIGRFVFQLLGSIAELDRANITEQMTMGRDRAARAGRYTGGPIPLGYDLDAAKRLVKSERFIPELGMTEAGIVRDLYERIADGSTLVTEANRLNALGFVPVRRYAGGTTLTLSTKWTPGRLWTMLQNPIYHGGGMLNSRNGAVVVPIPALVDRALWEAAREALSRNKRRGRPGVHRTYLLRGLITCENCGMSYTGRTDYTRAIAYSSYRCNSTSPARRTEQVCGARGVGADWLEGIVWDDVRAYAYNPEERLADAQCELRERLAQTTGLEDRRRALIMQIAEKDAERERVLTMYRRGRVTIDEAERDLDTITRETGTLREMLDALRAQETLAEAQEAHLTDAAAMLRELRTTITEIEAANDTARKREIIELLVSRITIGTDTTEGRRRATVTIRYAFERPRVYGNGSTRQARG